MEAMKKAFPLGNNWFFFTNACPSVEHYHEDKQLSYLPLDSADGYICRICGDEMPDAGISAYRMCLLKNPPTYNEDIVCEWPSE